MDSSSLDHYEERLYSVFKTFDVGNEESLGEAAVLALCDALQLEARGAALAGSLFERRDQRVTFAQFRSGLLAVLGDQPAPAPEPDAPASDDDSSGREVAPKFVFGSKKYGRRSRPAADRPAPSSSPTSSPPTPPGSSLDHSSRVDCERALALCRRLRMDGIDRRLVEGVFESVPAGETTVGEFFDRLNTSLSSSMEHVAGAGGDSEPEEDEELPAELVAACWERAGVPGARRLLADLGCAGVAVSAARLERALREESGEGGAEARALLLQAALALARLRRSRAARAAAAAAAERDRLRADVDEANRRALILAQEVDENLSRLEAERAASLRRVEARHAEALRRAGEERAAERERWAAERAALEADISRRGEAEARLRAAAEETNARAERLEARAAEAEARAAGAERERARLAEDLRAAVAAGGDGVEEIEATKMKQLLELASRLRGENAALRDRCDELGAQLEARAAPRDPPPPPPPAHTWHEEAGENTLAALTGSPPASLDPPPPDASDASDASEQLAAMRAQLLAAERAHDEERQRLEELVNSLESSLEAMRVEYERCEEYWSGKLSGERALAAGEQRAADERLGELARRVEEYERQFAASLHAIPETPALEAQAAELEAAAGELQRREEELRLRDAALAERCEAASRREVELSLRREKLVRRERELARATAELQVLRRAAACGVHGGVGAGAEAGLVARVARAEAGAARLAARLAAADLLVKDLYVENCRLAPLPRTL